MPTFIIQDEDVGLNDGHAAANAERIIVGAGISGLALASRLQEDGYDALLLERSGRLGGSIRSERIDGRLVEAGPNSTLETTPLLASLIREAGIENRKQYADARSDKRFILRDGKLKPIPMSPAALISTDLFSWKGKMRLLREPFIGPSPADTEETVSEFVRRRLGAEFLDYAINPFVAGVYAGDPDTLSVQAAFPKLHALEQRYGGLIKGQIRGARERKRSGETAKQSARMFSFADGMETLTAALGGMLKRVETGITVQEIEWIEDGRYRFRITASSKDRIFRYQCRVLVLSMAAYDAGPLVRNLAPKAAEALLRIHYPPVAVVATEYRRSAGMHPLDGFGFLIPRVERREILGTIFTSSLFEGRAETGSALLTSFVGGARQPEKALLSEDAIGELVLREQGMVLGVPDKPDFMHVTKWERAIPQYTLGHTNRMIEIEKTERELPGLFFCANYRGGISVGDCVVSAERTAGRIRSMENGVKREK